MAGLWCDPACCSVPLPAVFTCAMQAELKRVHQEGKRLESAAAAAEARAAAAESAVQRARGAAEADAKSLVRDGPIDLCWFSACFTSQHGIVGKTSHQSSGGRVRQTCLAATVCGRSTNPLRTCFHRRRRWWCSCAAASQSWRQQPSSSSALWRPLGSRQSLWRAGWRQPSWLLRARRRRCGAAGTVSCGWMARRYWHGQPPLLSAGMGADTL